MYRKSNSLPCSPLQFLHRETGRLVVVGIIWSEQFIVLVVRAVRAE